MATYYKLMSGVANDERFVVFESESDALENRDYLVEDGYSLAHVTPVEMTPEYVQQLCDECPVDSVSDFW